MVTASTAAPSEMPQELPAVAVPSAPNDGRSLARRAAVIPGRGRSSTETCCDGNDFRLEDAGLLGVDGARMGARRVLVLPLPGDAASGGQGVGGLAHVGVGESRWRERRAGVAHRLGGAARTGGGRPEPPRRGARRFRTAGQHQPASPARTRDAACSTASSPDPHCRSTVTPGTAGPRPAASAETLAMFPPGPRQLPRMTSSTGSSSGAASSATSASTGAVRPTTSTADRAWPGRTDSAASPQGEDGGTGIGDVSDHGALR